MGLHRHIEGILSRLGLDESQSPDDRDWDALTRELTQFCQGNEDKIFLLERMLVARTKEVQSLYRSLVLHRDQLDTVLQAVPTGFILFDAHGQGLLMNSNAEDWLDWSVGDEVPGLARLGVYAALGGVSRLQERLGAGLPCSGYGALKLPGGRQLAVQLTLQPLVRRGRSRGSFLTFRPWSAEERIENLQSLANEILAAPLSPQQAVLVRNILESCREATESTEETSGLWSRLARSSGETSPASTPPTQRPSAAQLAQAKIERLAQNAADSAERQQAAARAPVEAQRRAPGLTAQPAPSTAEPARTAQERPRPAQPAAAPDRQPVQKTPAQAAGETRKALPAHSARDLTDVQAAPPTVEARRAPSGTQTPVESRPAQAPPATREPRGTAVPASSAPPQPARPAASAVPAEPAPQPRPAKPVQRAATSAPVSPAQASQPVQPTAAPARAALPQTSAPTPAAPTTAAAPAARPTAQPAPLQAAAPASAPRPAATPAPPQTAAPATAAQPNAEPAPLQAVAPAPAPQPAAEPRPLQAATPVPAPQPGAEPAPPQAETPVQAAQPAPAPEPAASPATAPAPAQQPGAEPAPLPAAMPAAPESPPEPPISEPPPVQPLRVLLVEDEPISLLVAQECIESLGHTCLVAGDGNEALNVVRRQPINAVITSFHMPGINGVELCRRVRQLRPGAFCILLTSLDATLEADSTAGVDAMLTKPLENDQLAACLTQAATRPRPD